MTYASDSQTIRERFNTQWPIEQPTIAYSFADVDYDPVEDNPWVRLNILTGNATQVAYGLNRRFRRTGIVLVQIFVPAGRGDGLAKELADSVANIFEGRTVSGIIFRAADLDRVGVDGSWAVWRCSVPYQSDDLRQIS